MDVDLKIDPRQFAVLQQRLSAVDLRAAIPKALNRVANSLRTRVTEDIKRELALKRADVPKNSMKVEHKATRNEPFISLSITKKKFPLFDFVGVEDAVPWGVFATLYRGKGRMHFAHYFQATTLSGHKGIFGRMKHLPNPPGKCKPPRTDRSKHSYILKTGPQAGFASTHAIGEVFGPSPFSLYRTPARRGSPATPESRNTPLFADLILYARQRLRAEISVQFRRFAAGIEEVQQVEH